MLGPKLMILVVIVAMLATGVYIGTCSYQNAHAGATGDVKCDYTQKIHAALEDTDISMAGGGARR